MEYDAGFIFQAFVIFVSFLIALCFHEYAHGWVANKLGDPTAKLMGRLTLDPTAHADPLGTYILPLAAILMHTPFIGWAKPVPVNDRNLRRPKSGMFWVSLAGPGSNILMAIMGAIIYAFAAKHLGSSFLAKTGSLGFFFVQINLNLAFFNFLPIHPLDGGKIFGYFLPTEWDRKLQEMQGILSIALFVLILGTNFGSVLFTPIFRLSELVLGLSFHFAGVS